MPKPIEPSAPSWTELLRRIREVQAEILLLAPHRDIALVPNPGARPDDLARAERRMARRLPPSYRSFLERHDGWPRFFEGASLLGTRDLGKSSYADLAQAAFEAAETPIPADGPPSARVRGAPRTVIPFGIDPDGTTLFAFDPAHTRPDGEMGVVAWISELGLRRQCFSDFLATVLDLCEADFEATLELYAPGQAWSKTA
jgi:hypothetical protein